MQPTLQHFTQPTRVRRTEETSSGLREHRPTPDFVFVVYEKSWEYVEGEGWLPVPKRITARPGANGVSDRGEMSAALAAAARKGGAVIDPRDTRLGEYQDYVAYYETATGKRHHVEWCLEATQLKSGEVMWDEEKARPQWLAFRRHLRDSGIVPGMIESVYRLKVATQQKHIERVEARYADKPALQHRIQEQYDRLEAMKKAWGAMASEPVANQPKPKRVRKEAADG